MYVVVPPLLLSLIKVLHIYTRITFSTFHFTETPGPISSEPFILDSGRNWITLSWGKPQNRGAGPIVAYRVEMWQTSEEGGARWTELGVSPVNSFDVFNLKPGGEYNFRITPRNRYGWGESFTTSSPIGVGNAVVNLPEFVKILPGQMKALVGTDLTLKCEIQSDAAPTITWYKNSIPIDLENETRLAEEFDGKNCQLTINSFTEDDSGRYMCEAINKMGRVSTFVTVVAVNDPKILEADANLKK